MCGIVGYVGKKDAVNVILEGLKNLEYRGYDSAGVAFLKGNEIKIFKAKGKIKNLDLVLKGENTSSNLAIGHTRWATHGSPSKTNAHPHRHGKVTLVHNGIIENYSILKDFLIKNNVKFYSDTDTEVACAYIDYMYNKNFDNSKSIQDNIFNALKVSCKDFKGSYSFSIIFDDDTSSLYAIRKDSPLIIGLGQGENFIGSDISVFLEYTNKYILLNENEIARLSDNDVTIYDFNGNILSKNIEFANLDSSQYKKNDFEHFMLKEIYEQPKVIADVFKRYFKNIDENYKKIDFTKYDKIHIVACGSAMHAGLIGKYLFENYANIPTDVEIASEYRYKKNFVNNKTLVILVSQSGETADTLAALRLSKKNNIDTLAIINANFSTIAREALHTIYTKAGPEIAVATTKGYTTQVATFITLCLNAAKQKNIVNENMLKELINDVADIENILNEVLDKKDTCLEIAKKIYNHKDIFFIGRGNDYNICMEGSLKLKEISYLHSEAYPAGELKHGTISLIENGTPVIASITEKSLFDKTISNIEEVKARGAYTIVLTTENLKKSIPDNVCDIILDVKDISFMLQSISIIILLQLIAYNVAKLNGCDIDKPKNLAKSVTVE